MMHKREKSDPSTVAAKPTNNSGPPEAEPGEPREGAKGNRHEPHTHRTQSRVSVSPGLGRVRERARQGKKGSGKDVGENVTLVLMFLPGCSKQGAWEEIGPPSGTRAKRR